MTHRKTVTRVGAQDCASKLKVLADGTRLAVLETLLEGPRHVADLCAALRVEQSLLSHHLRVLRDAGLVEAARDGKSVLYRIASGMEHDRPRRAIRLGCCDLSFAPPRGESRRRELGRG